MRLRRALSQRISLRPDPHKTVSMLSNQLHDPSISKLVEDSCRLADGAYIETNAYDNSSSIALLPVASQWVCNPVHAYLIRNATTHLGTGTVYLADSDQYFVESSWGWGKYRTLSPRSYRKRRAIKIVSKRPVYIFSSSGYHGIVEDLAAILKLLDFGYQFNVVIDPSDRWMNGLLDLFLPTNLDRIEVARGSWVNASKTFAVTKSAFGEFVNPDMIKTLNKAGREYGEGAHTKDIFIARADSYKRQFNTERLENRYRNLGYETVILGEMKVRDQVSLFRSARRVAGMHGAGFVNLLWSDPGVCVNEYYHHSHFNSCYFALSHHLAHVYACHLMSGA